MKTIYKNIRFIFLFTGMSLFLLPTVAQTTNTGYFMKSQYSRTSLNPALRPEQGYIGIPGLTNIYVDYKTNFLNLETFFFPGRPAGSNKNLVTFLHEGVTADQFLKNISKNNYASADVATTILGIGFYSGEGFWTVDLGLKANMDFNLPYDLFEFAKKGLSDDKDRYDLKGIQSSAITYLDLGVGHSRPFLDDKLVVGLKAKILFGMIREDLNVKQLALNAGSRRDMWTLETQASLNYTARELNPEYDEDDFFNGFFNWPEHIKNILNPNGFGLGFDLGATYKLSGLEGILNGIDEDILDRFTFSAALTDVGFISWSKKYTKYLATKDTETELIGNLNFSTNEEDDDLEEQFEAIGDKFKEAINLEETGEAKGYTTGLRTKMNFGLEYEFIKDQLSAGLLSTTRFSPVHNLTEFTLAGAYKPVNWFEAGLSYSFVHGYFKTFGLALNFVPVKGINLFLASDYLIPHITDFMFLPTSTKAFNYQFGLTVPLGGSKR